MDTLLEDQTLQAVLGRADFSGIDNAALDFSQLEDYINDEDDSSIYFQEALVTTDLRLPESPRTGNKLPANREALPSAPGNPPPHPASLHPVPPVLQTNQQPLGSVSPPTPAPRTSTSNVSISGAGPVTSSLRTCGPNKVSPVDSGRVPILSHPQVRPEHPTPTRSSATPPGHPHPHPHPHPVTNTTTSTHITSTHIPSLYNNKQPPQTHPHPHHLPESPPDSGSEPPFSPPNDDNSRVSGSGASGAALNHQQPDMMQPGHGESLKHYLPYPGHQVMKHLPHPHELTINVPPPHLHSPQHISHPHLNPHLTQLHSIPGANGGHPDGPLLSHLGGPVMPGPLGLQATPGPPGLPPGTSGHLTTLYSANEDYLPQGCGDCVGGSQDPQVGGGSHHKKRKISGSPKSMINGGLPSLHIKQEPGRLSPEPTTSTMIPIGDDDYGFDYNNGPDGPPSVYLDSTYQCIRFQPFQQNLWHTLCDASLKELPTPNYRVDADKGFNFSNADDAFVCQKKNHFQVTVHVQPIGVPKAVKTPEGTKKVDQFVVHFYGVKVESPSQTIKVEQSQSDRSKKPFHPVPIELSVDQVSKTTVGRLHFSETTSNNMRKKGKPNPDQRYFYLVVGLCAHVGDQASNPGQFENDMELTWQKGHTPESIYHAGRVGVNTDRPDETLVVHGNVKITGHIIQPSDTRAKTNIQEMDTKEQLKNVSNMRIVKFDFIPEFAKEVGLGEGEMQDTGVLAQEVQQILPDAVKEAGDMILSTGERIENFLVVNKDRIFMENVGAVKELCKVTDNLETRIDELERMNSKLRKINRFDSIKSVMSSSSASVSTVTCNSSYSSVVHSPKRGEYKQQCNHRSHRKCVHETNTERNVCTNKFMQSIIMVLVLIMAFCLASIATLYILEYHKRHNHLSNIAHSGSGDGSSYYGHTVNNSPYSPSSVMPSNTNAIQNTFSNQDKDKQNSIYMNQPTNTNRVTSPTASIPILKPRVIGIPHLCLEPNSMVPSCAIHCCQNPSNMDRLLVDGVINLKPSHLNPGKEKENKPREPTSSTRQITEATTHSTTQPTTIPTAPLPLPSRQPVTRLLSGNNVGSTIKTSAFSHDEDPILRTRFVEENFSNTVNGERPNDSLVLAKEEAVGESESSGFNDSLTQHLETKRQLSAFMDRYGTPDIQNPVYSKAEEVREKRESSESHHRAPLFKPVQSVSKDLSKAVESLKLIEINTTIGREFCTTLQCVQGHGPRFTFLLPISKFMAYEFITLQLSLNSALKVDHCEYKEKPTSCPSPLGGSQSVPISYHRPSDHMPTAEMSPFFSLPVGLYLRSSYIFRVLASGRDVDTPCSLPESEIGASFVEYKFIFTRKCDK